MVGVDREARAQTDGRRDEVALGLAGRMIERGRPVFGICRGVQELNVLFGGTLATGRVLDYRGRADEERRLCSLYLALLNRMGVRTGRFGDAASAIRGL